MAKLSRKKRKERNKKPHFRSKHDIYMGRTWPKTSRRSASKHNAFSYKNLKLAGTFMLELFSIMLAMVLLAALLIGVIFGAAFCMGYAGSKFGMGNDNLNNGFSIIFVIIVSLIAIFFLYIAYTIIKLTCLGIARMMREHRERKEQELVDLLTGVHG